MSENLIHFQPSTPARPDAAIYTVPVDVVADPKLTTADKRAILASWVSDARAVEDAPTLRRLDSGAVVEIAAVFDALRRLDRSVSVRGDAPEVSLPCDSGVVVRLPLRAARPHGFIDDDPPLTPTRSGMPPPPIFVDAYGGG